MDRLQGKVVVVVGGGQTLGETIGNGRAAAIVYAREGARVVVVDRDHASADDTVDMIRSEGGDAIAHVADITDTTSCATIPTAAMSAFGGLDVLHNNVGIGGGARHGIRVNAVLPGLMNTPMAIEGISAARGVDRESLITERDVAVPLGRKMGIAWDVAYASLFLASDEAKFITGVLLPVDGGQSVRRG